MEAGDLYALRERVLGLMALLEGHHGGDHRIAPKVSPGGHFGGVLPDTIEPEQDMEIDAKAFLLGSCWEAPPPSPPPPPPPASVLTAGCVVSGRGPGVVWRILARPKLLTVLGHCRGLPHLGRKNANFHKESDDFTTSVLELDKI